MIKLSRTFSCLRPRNDTQILSDDPIMAQRVCRLLLIEQLHVETLVLEVKHYIKTVFCYQILAAGSPNSHKTTVWPRTLGHPCCTKDHRFMCC